MKKLMTVALAAFAGGSLFADLPEGYVPVEYVESTGQQYIEKIHTVKTNTTVVIDFTPYKLSTDTAFFAMGWNGGFTLNTQAATPNNFFYGYGTMYLGPAKIGTEYVATVSQGKATVAEKFSHESAAERFRGEFPVI